jgi:DNA-binding MarR family transcriptional regulator
MSTANDDDIRQPHEVDRLIHEPARYNIMALLYVVERAEFLFVRNRTGLTPGNLSAHLSKLETAGYLAIQKEFVGKIPRTFLSLTELGRESFADYHSKMKALFSTPPGTRKDSDNNRFLDG